MENLNFFPEETGFENNQDDFVNPSGRDTRLCLYQKEKFLSTLTQKTSIFINDSILSFNKYYPTIIDVKVPIRVIGSKIEEQLKKITDFFSIDSKEYLLIIGDNDNFRVKGRDNMSMILNGDNEIEGDSYILDYNDIETYLELYEYISKKLSIFGKRSVIFLAAAVSDFYIPKEKISENKIQSNEEGLMIQLFPIKKEIYKIKTEWNPNSFLISFKLETDKDILFQKANKAIIKTKSDLIVANLLQTRYKVVYFISPNEKVDIIGQKGEDNIEKEIVNEIVKRHELFLK